MNEDWHDLFPLYRVVPMPLAGAGFALDDRIYGFQVAGVRGEGEANFFTRRGGDLVFIPEVIFHVSIPQDGFGDIIFVKFGKQFAT